MLALACLQELQHYSDLLPDLHDQRAGHRNVLRGLPGRCLACLHVLAAQALMPPETRALEHARQLIEQAAAEAAARQPRWHLVRAYLHEGLAAWPTLCRHRLSALPTGHGLAR